jgi:hypothetical protein
VNSLSLHLVQKTPVRLESTYVFEKILDIMSYRQIFTQTTQQGAQDSYNLKADKGLQIEDMPTFSTS